MAFLTPLFLVGLAGLSIPVLLHLIQKERRNVVHFPSLMFIRRIPYQSVQRRRIRHWLLLAMRLAALALLVFAFGRPFFRRTDAASAAGTGAREVVVLLDRSYSMGYGGRWQKAIAAAQETINGLNPADRGTIVVFASNAEVALRSTADRSRLLAVAAGVQPGAGATRYGPALKLAGSVLGESALPRREVVLITDFQRTGWQGAEGVRLPEGTTLSARPVGDAETANLSVTPVSLQRSTFSNQQRIAVTAGVVNHGPAAVKGVELSLELGGRGVQTRRVDVEPGGSASATFDPVTVAEKNVRAAVRLPKDALERDNVFNFVASPDEPVRVVLAERPGAPRDGSLYLTRALAVGEAPRFEVTARGADGLSAEDLAKASVVVLNDVPVSSQLAERLTRYVEGGGGLLVIAGDKAAWAGAPAVLPGVLGNAVDRTSGNPARLGALEYGHPALEVFRAPRTGDFAAARFYGYRAVEAAPGTQVLARYDDGAAALLERRSGAGRVLMWTSSIDTYWNDLAVRPVYLPLMHRLLRYLGDYSEPAPWRTVGDVVDAPAGSKAARAQTSRVALTPSGQRVSLDGEGPEVLELTEQGFYEIRAQEREAAAAVVASNVDLAESDMTGMDPKEVAAATMGRVGDVAANGTPTPPSDDAQEGAQRVWWYLIFAGMLFLAAETIVGNRSTV